MGAGASLDLTAARVAAGEHFDEDVFAANAAADGTITREQFLSAAATKPTKATATAPWRSTTTVAIIS